MGQADRFGYFSLPTLTGDPSLPEVFVKMIDATSLEGNGFWAFFGSLTSVPYSLAITDTDTGRIQVYDGDAFCGSSDIAAFPPDEVSVASARATATHTSLASSGEELLLLGHRFRLTLTATNRQTGVTASGVAIPQGDRFGYFSLPGFTGDPNFPEVFVKMLDATSLENGDFWLFHTGLTSLSYTITLVDSASGAVKRYQKFASSALYLCGGADLRVSAVLP